MEDYPDYPTTDGKVTGANRKFAFQAMLQALDTEIGRLMESVDLNSTNIILIGDNGTTGSVIQKPYDSSHSKGSLYQGGIRVPLIISGPDVIQRGTTEQLVHCVDLFSTITDLANLDTNPEGSKTIDSKSLVPILSTGLNTERKVISEIFGKSDGGNGRVILNSKHPNYKLIIWGEPRYSTEENEGGMEMYNISLDSNEQTPLNLPLSLIHI